MQTLPMGVPMPSRPPASLPSAPASSQQGDVDCDPDDAISIFGGWKPLKRPAPEPRQQTAAAAEQPAEPPALRGSKRAKKTDEGATRAAPKPPVRTAAGSDSEQTDDTRNRGRPKLAKPQVIAELMADYMGTARDEKYFAANNAYRRRLQRTRANQWMLRTMKYGCTPPPEFPHSTAAPPHSTREPPPPSTIPSAPRMRGGPSGHRRSSTTW